VEEERGTVSAFPEPRPYPLGFQSDRGPESKVGGPPKKCKNSGVGKSPFSGAGRGVRSGLAKTASQGGQQRKSRR